MPTHPPQPYHDERPWGSELWLTRGYEAPSMVKILTVNQNEVLSLQYHHSRDEFWKVLSGEGFTEIDGVRIPLKTGDTQFIPRETKHRLGAGSAGIVVLELAFGTFDEYDIVRIEDRYGRS